MCGILFSYQPYMPEPELRARTEQAVGDLRHRGPDESGIWLQKNCAIGHTRLSIVDLSASQQPFFDPTGRYVLSFNGEIYNYQTLRSELKSQWHFVTNGDTEVLMAGLLLQGPSFIPKLEGMWAFALWDNHEKKLMLSRDRMGKKPLYYTQDGSSFSAASELPALLKLIPGSVKEDVDSTADYIRYGYYLPGHTIYKGIKEVLPGHNLDWEAGTTYRQHQYWQLRSTTTKLSKRLASDQINYLLQRAVDKRLIADVEVGAFLSGGIDSAIIVGLASNTHKKTIKTFTMGFDKKSFDESEYAREISHHFGTTHYEKKMTKWQPEQLNKLITKHIGQPFADSSILPTAMVSELASSHVKVALSGDGGDELFSGYQRYQARAILRWYTRLPNPLKKNFGKLIRALPEPASQHSRSVLKKAHLFADTIDRVDSETPYIAPMYYSNAQMAKLCPEICHRGHHISIEDHTTSLDDIEKMMLQDALIYMPQDILLKVDRASMAHSLEVRAPFLDHNLVELAFTLPLNWHRSMLSGKEMLKHSFRQLLFPSVWRRRKQGFGVPMNEWFNTFLGDELKTLSGQQNSHLSDEYICNMLITHRQGKRDLSLRLWQVYCYLKWKSFSPHVA